MGSLVAVPKGNRVWEDNVAPRDRSGKGGRGYAIWKLDFGSSRSGILIRQARRDSRLGGEWSIVTVKSPVLMRRQGEGPMRCHLPARPTQDDEMGIPSAATIKTAAWTE